MNCYEAIDVMGEAVENRLDPGLGAGFQEHMAECRPCRTYFEQLGVTRQALRRLARGAKPGTSPELLREYRAHFSRKPGTEESA